MRRKIAILIMSPLNKRDYERFGIEELSKSLDVKIIDLTPLIRPEVWNKFSAQNIHPVLTNSILVKNNFQFFLSIINFKPLFYIDYLGITFQCSFIRLFLRSFGVSRIVIDNALLPTPNKIKKSRMSYFFRFFDINVLQYVFNLLIDGSLTRPLLGVVSGSKYSKKVANAREKIFMHSFDYQKSLELNSKHKVTKKKYAVFIHQDNEFDQTRLIYDNSYYIDLSLFFKKIESTLKVDILIALHPRHRRLIFNFFDKKKCFSGLTAELIKHSSLVIDQFSAARQFAVIYEKPILNLMPRHYKKGSKLYNNVIQASKELGGGIFHLSSNSTINKKNIFKINKVLYKKYMENYIKTETSPNISLWKGIINWIEQYA
jgi:hypothetical protein